MKEKKIFKQKDSSKINRFFSVIKLKDAFSNVILKLLCSNNYSNIIKKNNLLILSIKSFLDSNVDFIHV